MTGVVGPQEVGAGMTQRLAPVQLVAGQRSGIARLLEVGGKEAVDDAPVAAEAVEDDGEDSDAAMDPFEDVEPKA